MSTVDGPISRDERDSDAATAALLWASCAGSPPPDTDAVLAALDAGADVTRAGRIALEQRIAPLLWRALVSVGRTEGLGEMGELLDRDSRLRRSQEALLLPLAIERSLGPLAAAGLEPLLFKGPAVAARYPAPGLRPMDDIDVLLPSSQHERGVSTLVAAGWKVYERPYQVYDTVLLHPNVPHLPVELHRELATWRNRSNALSADALWRLRVPMTVCGVETFGLPPEEELVALAAHAGKPYHHFNRLMWVLDLAVVVRATELDWDRVLSFATKVRARVALAVGLRMAARLGVDAPAEALELPPGSRRHAALRPLLEDRWPLTVDERAVRHRVRYALSDRPARQALLLLGDLGAEGGASRSSRTRLLSGAARFVLRSRRDRPPPET